MKLYFYRKHELGGWSIRRRLTPEQQKQSGKKYIHLCFDSTIEDAKEHVKLLERERAKSEIPQ